MNHSLDNLGPLPHSDPPFSPTFDKAKEELNKVLESDDYDFETKRKHFDSFTEKFTTPPRTWAQWIKVEIRYNSNLGKWNPEYRMKVMYTNLKKEEQHFPSMWYKEEFNEEYMWPQLSGYPFYLQTLVENSFIYETCLQENFDSFWNGEALRDTLLWHEINITKFSSFNRIKEIQESIQVYLDLLILNNTPNKNYKTWIKTLAKMESHEYIVKNIERDSYLIERKEKYKIKTWWKLLFHYSKMYDFGYHLDVYRRYCRLYVDDLKMRKKYRKTIKQSPKNFNNAEWILDSIKLEYDFVSVESANKKIRKFVKKKLNDSIVLTNSFEEDFATLKERILPKEKEIIKPKFNKNSRIFQNFSFPWFLVNYIAKEANYQVTQKLHYSCKQMYELSNKTLFIKLSITELPKTEIHDEAQFISAANPQIDQINNIFVFNALYVCYPESNTLSKFIHKIIKCDLRFLILSSQNLDLEEYYFLTKSGNVKGISLHNSIVTKNENEEKASLEELMKCLQKAENLTFIPSPHITLKTFNILANNEKRTAKINNFLISPITGRFDPEDFCSFLKKHAAANSKISIHHAIESDCYYLQPFLTQTLQTWSPSAEKPEVELYEN